MNKLLSLDFYGKPIRIIKREDDYYWIPVKQICENIGIDYSRQYKRLKSHRIIKTCIVHMYHAGKQKRDLFSIRKDYFGGWLFTINAERIPDLNIREKLYLYQEEIYKVIDDYLTHGVAINYHRFAHVDQAKVLPGAIDRMGRIKDKLIPARYAFGGKFYIDPNQQILNIN